MKEGYEYAIVEIVDGVGLYYPGPGISLLVIMAKEFEAFNPIWNLGPSDIFSGIEYYPGPGSSFSF